ncbi:ArsR/SmtB family transcription factor [Massilia agri]|uniref:Helix-turn-helix domain-containing protein n=1 Tax=Massilia agri TaxID=1886785 RepID=A0ABT2AHS7_9BURK|nr:helix-turn-helix domain-containing protein [Massilia agri]MCS0595789.1 helix-turn-helix domain-containing protein [Massilia agri]
MGPNITTIAALVGDTARGQVLSALMAGRALTATELADSAGVTRQTISTHLAQLVDAGMLTVEKQGRHRYFRIADEDVAQMLESLMGAAALARSPHVGPREPALRKARVCYDHLAGELGVLVYEKLAQRGAFALDPGGIALTPLGSQAMEKLGVELVEPKGRRPFCRTCLDWSERRHHLAGTLGAALLARFEQLGWAKRVPDSRVMAFSAAGEAALRDWLD